MSEDIIERIRTARLVWAMACQCECDSCEALFRELQRICKDIPAPQPAEPR